MRARFSLVHFKYVLAVAVVIVGYTIFAPHSAFACSNPGSIPAGFTTPCPVFDAEPTSVQASGSVTITVTPNVAKQFISQSIYIYNGSTWTSASLVGTFKSGYATTTATYTINSAALSQLPSGNIYLAEWDWTWNNTLKCFVGASSSICDTGNWRLQEFTLSGGQGGGTGGGGDGPITYPPSIRTDLCELNTDPGCSGKGLSFLGQNQNMATTGGVYIPTQTAPTGISGADLSNAQQCVTDPDFGTQICRVTNGSMGPTFNDGSEGQDRWAVDASKFNVNSAGGKPILFGFSTTTMQATESDIQGVTEGGSPIDFPGNGITFSSSNPNVMYSLDLDVDSSGGCGGGGCPIVELYKLTINNPTASPTQWTMTVAPMFDFEEGNPGHGAGNCLQYYPDGTHPLIPSWHGAITVSNNDQVFEIALGDNSQNGARGINKKGEYHYGATYLVSYEVGKGCRIMDTYGNNGLGPVTIRGDWGYTGPAFDGTGAQPGQTGGIPLTDAWYLHDAGPEPDNIHGGITGSTVSTQDSLGSECYLAKGDICAEYYWEIPTGNIRPVWAAGHAAKGALYFYKGKKYTALSYQSTTAPNVPLLTISVPVDQHGTYNNGDDLDEQPLFLDSTNVCGQQVGAGQANCDAQYTGPLYDEIFGVSNAAANPNGAAKCNYAAFGYSASSPCTYRFAHTFNTGTNWNFYTQNAEGEVSPTGQFFLFASDWNLQIGCTNGQNSGCLNNVSSTANSYCVNNYNTAACPRGDVFVVKLF